MRISRLVVVEHFKHKHPWLHAKIQMHVFEGRYFNVNRWFHIITGLWPFATERRKNVIRCAHLAFLFALSMPHLLSMIVNFDDVDRVMLNFISYCTVVIGIFKMSGLIVAEDRMIKLYESVASNWLTIRDENESEILHKYSERGRFLTIMQAIYTSQCIGVTLLPLIPKILDKLNPPSEPRPNMYVLAGEFFVDRNAHFVELCLVDAITIAAVSVVIVAADTMYVACSQHSCALYAIVSYRLRKLKRAVLDDYSSATADGDSYDWLVETVRLHEKALTFTSTLNDAYSSAFLLILPTNLFLVPFSSCAILANLDRPLHLVPYAAYFIATAVHLLILCWPGQVILDHQFDLHDDAGCNEWYATTFRTKKLLLILMIRCSQPAAITAGGLITLNYETFSFVFRTAVSYITVAASYR